LLQSLQVEFQEVAEEEEEEEEDYEQKGSIDTQH
jgi:hypothetical protein